jgi:hypothetical protein
MALQWALRQRDGTEIPAKCLESRITPRPDSYRVLCSTEMVRSNVEICNQVGGWASSPDKSAVERAGSSQLATILICQATGNSERIGLKTRAGDRGLVGQKSPAMMFLATMRTVPGCCCWHVPAFPPTRHPCPWDRFGFAVSARMNERNFKRLMPETDSDGVH